MKKKGFTLLELIGVIVIISLLVLLVVPGISNIVKQSQTKVDKQTQESLILAAKNWATNNKKNIPKRLNASVYINISDLINEGYVEMKSKPTGCIKITNKKADDQKKDVLEYEYIENQSNCISSGSSYNVTIYLSPKTAQYTGDKVAANKATVVLENSETYTGNITYTYYTNSACTQGASTTAPTNVGTYYVKATTAAFSNYAAGASNCITHKITKSNTTTTLSDQTKTYNGTNQAASGATATLNSTDEAISNAAFTYKYYTNNACTEGETTTAPKTVGQYYVKAQLNETSNYSTSSSQCVSYKINPLALTNIKITAYETPWVNGATTYTRNISTGVGNETINLIYTPYSNTVGTFSYATTASSGKFTLSQTNTNYVIDSAGDLNLTDSEKPTTTIEGATTLKQTSQSVTLKCSDNIGVIAYYWGTTNPTSASSITTTTSADLTALQGNGLSKTGLTNGTYYLGCKDSKGNFDKKSIVIRKYQVQNVLEKIAGTTGTYNNTNYATEGSATTYYVKDGTTLTLASIYTAPTAGNQNGKFKGYTTSAPTTTTASPSTTAPTMATNNTTTYYMWFARNTYTITVTKPTNGSITAETVTQTNNSITVSPSSTSNGSLIVKSGDTVKATATANSGYKLNEWSGGYISGNTSPKTGTTVTANKTITASFNKIEPIIKSWNGSSSSDFHAAEYRENIVSIVFENTINIPEGATSWDISKEANSKTVMAWVTTNQEDNTKYDLHIAGDGKVIANSNSSSTFRDFSKVISIDFNNNYDTSNVTTMSGMFAGCKKLQTLNLGDKFDTSKVTTMSGMFNNCQDLKNLDLGDKFDTSNVTIMSTMFAECNSLKNLDLGDKFDTSKVTTMSAMFSNCTNLETLDLGDKFDTSSVTTMSSMFDTCASLQTLDLGDNFDTSNVTSMSKMFYKCTELKSIDLGDKFDTSRVENMYQMFDFCTNLTTLDLGDKFDTSNVTNMSRMFYYCSHLESLDLGNKFDTSKLTDTSYMFYRCGNLESLDLGDKFDTGTVTNMHDMFGNCHSLETLNLGNKFDTSTVTNTSYMFYNCYKLKTLDLGDKFNTSNVTNMQYMFANCHNLENLDLGDNFDTSNVTTMDLMFSYCSNLTSIDLGSKFDTSKVTDMQWMFISSPKLQTIYASNKFVTTAVTNGDWLFTNDYAIVGGNGTTYSSENVDYSYARIDTPSTPGYFTNYLTPRVSTRTTSSTITVIASLDSSHATITKYEFSKNNGSSWINNGSNNMYTFTGLDNNTAYPILVRVTDNSNNKETSKLVNVTPSSISVPTYNQINTSLTNINVEITYPKGCGSTYTCTYKKNNGSAVTVTSNIETVNFTANGTIIATVSDGANTVSSTYTVAMPTTVNKHNTTIVVVTSGDGLYQDTTTSGRYVYKGGNPNNYIKLGDEEYRILAFENDGTIKVIKENRLIKSATINTIYGNYNFDPGYKAEIEGITDYESVEGTRWTNISTDYCYQSDNITSYLGCKVWGSKNTVLDANGNHITVMPRGTTTPETTYTLPEKEAYINTHMNTIYLNSLPSSVQNKIVNHTFNIGPVSSSSLNSFATNMNQESAYKWNGKIGLMTVIDYVKASKNTACTNVYNYHSNENCYNKSTKHNYLYKPGYYQWLLTPESSSTSYRIWNVAFEDGSLEDYWDLDMNNRSGANFSVRPVFHLSSNTNLSGTGTKENPYTIS